MVKEKEREERMPGRIRASFAQRREPSGFSRDVKKRKKGPKISESLLNEEKKREEKESRSTTTSILEPCGFLEEKKRKKRKRSKGFDNEAEPRGGKRKTLLWSSTGERKNKKLEADDDGNSQSQVALW